MSHDSDSARDAHFTNAPDGAPYGTAAPTAHQTPLWTLKATQLLAPAASACFSRFITVYYVEIGVSRTGMGVLQCIGPFVAFGGQMFWSSVIDNLREYKRILIGTEFVGTVVIFCHLLPAVQENYSLLLCVTILWNFLLSTSGPIIDSMTLQVLADQNVTDEAYGDQRLWCAVGWGGMSLIAGKLIDELGLVVMFVGFACIEGALLLICIIWLPSKVRGNSSEDDRVSTNEVWRSLCTFDALWFFANLLVFGVAMSLVEAFLLVFILQDFVGTSKALLGAATAVMCAFEVPVFKYIGRLWTERGVKLTTVLLFCQLTLALRCWLYTLLPPQYPWLVLLVEPLHGVTFAAMWAASVEYGQRIAPPRALARMQALVNGVYEKIAMGLGSIIWGAAVTNPPRGLGFRNCFFIDAVFVIGWCVIWQAGLRLRGGCGARMLPGLRSDSLAEASSADACTSLAAR